MTISQLIGTVVAMVLFAMWSYACFKAGMRAQHRKELGAPPLATFPPPEEIRAAFQKIMGRKHGEVPEQAEDQVPVQRDPDNVGV